VPALESAHALAGARHIAERSPGCTILVGLSGRGDKDLPSLVKLERQLAAQADGASSEESQP
jgi:tryptophan synthase beta subunit